MFLETQKIFFKISHKNFLFHPARNEMCSSWKKIKKHGKIQLNIAKIFFSMIILTNGV